MHRFIGMLIILVLISGCASFNSSTNGLFDEAILKNYPELKGSNYHSDKVSRVVDGDTFETESGDKVRLIGVDTPESTKTVEPFGKEASKFSSDILTGKTVHLFQDVGDKDRYGRLLRYVFIEGETTMFNERLVKEGYANPMTVPPNVLFAELFVAREREAREQQKGLWKNEHSSSVRTTTDCENPKIKGNINSKNEKIYHVPDGRYYDHTKAEVMFCSEEEAISAGFRKSKQ